MALTRTQAATILTNLGWRVNTAARLTQAIKDFQRGWNLGTALTVDGLVGPKTSAALTLSEARRRKGLPTASANFSFTEFRCKCGGKYASCRRTWVLRYHIQRLESYRAKIGRGVSITSGCRCVGHNSAVGGASNSQHLYGVASDIQGVDKDTVKSYRLFAGIGYGGKSDRALHVDSRDLGGNNKTGGRTYSPTMWVYSAW
jgi:zinc D-Ala-D-Ala carboxypeptidase